MAPEDPLGEERREAGVAFVSSYTNSLHQCLQKLIEVLQQAIMKNLKLVVWHYFRASPLVPQARSSGIRTRQKQQPGPAGQEHPDRSGPDLTFTTEVASKAMIFLKIQQQTGGYWMPTAQPCPLHIAVNTTRLLPPTQSLAKPTPDINNLTGKTFLN